MINKYPYTDFNEYNMDWIIKTVKDLTVQWAETHQEWLDVQTEWTNYKNYIDNYFAQLDLSQEVSDKIDQMAANGYFSDLFNTLFRDDIVTKAGQVTSDWISNNLMQETGYVIDASLTVANAAADAKAVGDAIADITDIIRSEKIDFISGSYIATNVGVGSVVNLTPVSNGSFSHAVIPCAPGDKFLINARGWTTGRLWAFIDVNNILLWVSDQNVTVTDLILTAPDNAAKLIINSWTSYLGDCYDGLTIPANIKIIDNNFENIYDQLCVKYDIFEAGTINNQGTPVDSTSIMRTAGFIPLENIKYITIGTANYIYLYLYDMYGYFVGYIVTLGFGQGYPNNITYNDIKTQFPTAYNLKITVRGTSPVTPSNIAATGIDIMYYQINKQVVVDVNGSGDYTSILRALKETAPTTKVYVKQGVYDEIAEYTDYYGADFWDDYAGYGGLNDDFLRGYFVSAGRILEFESGAIVECMYTGNNTNVSQYFSPLATGYNATIIGGHIIYDNTRYGLHDDAAAAYNGTTVLDGIIFEGYNIYYGSQIGGGMGVHKTYYLKNLVFIDDHIPANYGDIYYHNNISADAENRLFIQNCYGERGIAFLWYGNSTKTSYCIASNNHFKSIKAVPHSADPHVNENITLIKFNNTETN